MSSGYASRLKEYPDKGVCGLPELKETSQSYNKKVKHLADLMKKKPQRIVVLTGAGISTSSGIPDFRGPNGIWTKELESQKKCQVKNKKRKDLSMVKDENIKLTKPSCTDSTVLIDFAHAKPSFTHNAITNLVSMEIIHYCVTQNVDGLHRRSGLPRTKHAVLHGCVFTEKCELCCTEYFREKEVGGMSFQKTGRKCDTCGGSLRDTLLDWDDALPEDDFERATEECENADLVLCLGTSLRIVPAGDLPTFAKKFVIVNLQETPYDSKAALVIRAKVDDVMKDVLEQLGISNWEYKEEESHKKCLVNNKKRKDVSVVNDKNIKLTKPSCTDSI
jgi:NAD+-dependent protein deacetylase sirtuin 6